MEVSIICTIYNKEPWIDEVIQGFLKQKCNFDYEIILVDDASRDHSPSIIEHYQEKYPDKIRTVFHRENLGITKTWIESCKLATGKYIARCDGDDYWIDEYKLQKQVDLLKFSRGSRWSCSDFDIISGQKNLYQKNAIQNGIIRKISNFEEMLAFKGMTMSSTWLVDRDLMLEVNDSIPNDAVDDTFCIQLELFTRTKLLFLQDSTTVYRLHDNSDSHPKSFEKMASRFEKLQDLQGEYLEKYYDKINLKKLSNYLFSEITEQEKILTQRQEELLTQLENAQTLFDELIEEKAKLKSVEERLNAEIIEKSYWLNEFNRVVQSKRWIVTTKIINFFRRNR